jgi:hypothetical protein
MAFYYGTGGTSGTYIPSKPPTPIMSGSPIPRLPPFYGATGWAAPTGGTYAGASTAGTTPAASRPSIDFSNLNFSNDPILGRIKALGQESIAQAEAEARSARTRLIIGYGDQNLANKLKLGTKVGKRASENPFSTLAELKRAYQRRNVFEVDAPLSDRANLFYSTERLRQQALSGETYLRGQSQAESAVQEQLAQISHSVIQAKMAAQAQQIQAEQEAYNRAIQMAMYAAGTG